MSASLPGDWNDLVVVCAGTSWDGIRMPEKHIAARIAGYAPVLYVDPPISRFSARRFAHLAESLESPGLRLVGPSLARLTPVVLPGMRRVGMRRMTVALTRRALRRAVASLGGSVRAVVVAGPSSALFGACAERLKVLYATDDFGAGADLMGVAEAQLRRDEVRLACMAERVVVVSPALAEKWRSLGQDPILVPNGCDDELFATTDEAPYPDDIDLKPPIAGFIGHLSERIDMTLLEAVAARGRSLLLVGPRQRTFELGRMEALLARPNVRWVGVQPFESLPSYLGAIDVGLTPYTETPFNRASYPLKTLEYLAGGRPVVTTDLPATRALDTDLVTIASGPEAFADAVERALAEARTPELISRRRAFAAQHSWTSRAADFAQAIGIDVPIDMALAEEVGYG